MFLAPTEVSALTGLRRPSAQVRWLAAHGWRFEVDAYGRPVVLRAEAERRMLGGAEGEKLMSDAAEKLRKFADNCLKLEAAGGNEGYWLQISHDLADGACEIDRLNDALVIARTTNANLLSYADEQRRLLQECWNAHVGASAGFSSDLWDRVRDAVMEGMY